MKSISFDEQQYQLIQRLLIALLRDPEVMKMSHEDFGVLGSIASLFAGSFDEK